MLVVELHRKLDLPRRSARGSDCSEVRVGVIARTADGYYAVTAKIWLIEVRVVEDVEELRAEFHIVPLSKRERLVQREVKVVDSWTRDLVAFVAQRGGAGQWNAVRC